MNISSTFLGMTQNKLFVFSIRSNSPRAMVRLGDVFSVVFGDNGSLQHRGMYYIRTKSFLQELFDRNNKDHDFELMAELSSSQALQSHILLHQVPWYISANCNEQRFRLFLLQDFIVRTDRSQLHLELLADAHPIHSWAGMNAEYQSLGSGNTGGVGDDVTKGNPSASCCRLILSRSLPLKTDFCLPQ